MIEAACCGSELVSQLRSPLPAGCRAALWWLGQAGFAVRMGTVMLVVDLYLSNHCEAVLARPFDHRRMSRAPLDAAEMTMVDALLCTHDHLDHLDVPTVRSIGSASPGSVAVVPAVAREQLRALDWPSERVVGMRAGQQVGVGDVAIESFAVAHEDWDIDERLGQPYQGFLVRHAGLTIAHVGDAVVRPETVDIVGRADPDVVLLPINGRSAARTAMGFAGNMSAEEAARFARDVGARMAVPMHYDMFAQNVDTDALGRFVRACDREGVDASALELGGALMCP